MLFFLPEDQWDATPLEPDDLDLELEKTLSRVRRANLAKQVAPEEVGWNSLHLNDLGQSR